MSRTREMCVNLLTDAQRRGLTPKAWWLGEYRHQEALQELKDNPDIQIEDGRIVDLEGLPVKVLSESPNKFGLWCEEGLLEL